MGVFKKGDNWYIDYYVNGRRKRKKIGPSKKLAQQVLSNVQTKIIKKDFLGIYEEKKITFKDFTVEYLEFSKANKAPKTYVHDKTNIGHLIDFFNDPFLFEITPKMIEKYKAERIEKAAPASVNRELSNLKHMYTKAIEWGYVNFNPAREVKKFKEPPGRIRYLKENEISKLLKVCPDYLKNIIIMAINTGMRKSELFQLRWSEVDLKNRKIIIINSKNNESRIIPINDTLHKVLSDLSEKSKAEYVFVNSKGKPFQDIKHSFYTALKNAEIADFRFHDLRHTFGSYMVMSGVDLRTVQQVLGHKDIKMTMRYSHLSPEYVQDAMKRLDKIWTLIGHQENTKESEEHLNS